MSSSDEEIPITVVKRRKRMVSREQVNHQESLYSGRVVPLLRKTDAQISRHFNNNQDAKKVIKHMPIVLSSSDDGKSSDDDIILVNGGSPIKEMPLTPPPSEKTAINSTVERKRKRLLLNIGTMQSSTNADVSLNQSLEGEHLLNEEMNRYIVVKVRFHSTVHKFPIRMDQTFSCIFDQLAIRNNIKGNKKLLLTLRDCTISHTDTPSSIGLSIADIMDCVILNEEVLLKCRQSRKDGSDCLKLHFQCKFEKAKKTYSVNKLQPLCISLQDYAKSVGYHLKQLTFRFDGDALDILQTPEELELEDDFCIDVMRKKL